MKARLICTVLIFSALLMDGCKKVEVDPPPAPVRTDRYFIEVTDRFYYENIDDYIEFVSSVTPEVESMALKQLGFKIVTCSSIKELSWKIYREQGNRGLSSHWRMERINFTYNSTSVTGEPIVLSGAIMLPNSTLPTVDHELDGVTLFNAYWLGASDTFATEGSMIMIRSSYNHLVVASDFQGYGITEGKSYHPFLEYFTLARQSIDCELAALELVEKMGVKLKKGYGTYVMGMSKGAPVAMAIQKMIENSEPEEVRRLFNLEGTYCCSGPYDLKSLLFQLNEGHSGGFLWLLPMIVLDSYYSHFALFADFKLEDFFTERFFTSRTLVDGREVSFLDVLNSQSLLETHIRNMCNELGFDTMEKIMSARFFNENGGINTEDRLVSSFIGVLESNSPYKGWSPKSPLLMEASTGDSLARYEVILNCYENLKQDERGVPNKYVMLNTYTGLDHDMISVFGMLRMFVMKNPLEPLL